VNIDTSQFEELGQRNQYRKQYSNWQEGSWNPFRAAMNTFGAGARKRNELASKAKETIMMGTLKNTLDAQGAELKQQTGSKAIFDFHDQWKEKFGGDHPMPEELNILQGIVKRPPTAALDLEKFRAQQSDKDKQIKDLSDRLKQYEKTPEDNEGKDPEPPTPGSK